MSFDNKKQLAHCQHCGKETDISNSSFVQKLMVQYKTQKDIIKNQEKSLKNSYKSKNGIIQSLHKLVGKLLNLMTDEQKEQAKQLNQETRDEIRKIEKQI
ncbi:MAG: hypothetical protein AABY22_18250 [Nanoarchaeota archaeon]